MGESLVRKKVAEEDLKEYSDKLLAKAIVTRSVEIEVLLLPIATNITSLSINFHPQRRYRAEVKRKLDFLAKLEIVEKIKVPMGT